jgi:hypothetical protein
MHLQAFGSDRPKKPAEREDDDDRVIEIPDDGKEVGNQVKRHGEIASHEDEDKPAAPWKARLTHQTGEQHSAIRYKTGDRSRVLASPQDEQAHDEDRVDPE